MITKKSNIKSNDLKKQFEESEKRYDFFRLNQLSRIEIKEKESSEQENRINDRFKSIRRK